MDYPLTTKSNRPRGENHFGAKLTYAQVKEIKQALLAGATCTELAKVYGVTCANISLINQGLTWKDVEV